MARLDPHSYNDDQQPAAHHLHWKASVDFASRTLTAQATLTFKTPATGPVDLDTRGLTIDGVTGADGAPLPFTLDAPEPILGARLRIECVTPQERVTVRYRTSPDASALQWLGAAQTSTGEPFLFSQCQAIHARSVLPVQDTPRLRITFRAELTVPVSLRALLAARFVSRVEEDRAATEIYELPEPIPPYLFAFAVGDLVSLPLGDRSRVWAEPTVVDAAAREFVATPDMLDAAERLFGPYPWERFDLLVMPPSFPYGGMENPRLTFLTPTLLAGDRSLVNVVAHELAHSWTGNLVTNANAEHFWLNEGFTVFAERRIVEALSGRETAELDAALGHRELLRTLADFAQQPELTHLCPDLAGVDPDDAFSLVPYEKGYLFLRTLEEALGRPAFDALLHDYIEEFRFRSLTTSDFCAFVERAHPGALDGIGATAWLYGAGLPANAPAARSSRQDAITALGTNLPEARQAAAWSATEWTLYLSSLPHPAPRALCAGLEARFQLTARDNAEVLCAWLLLAIVSEYDAVLPRAEWMLGRVGRMKYLKPLYTALARRPDTRALAHRLFEQHRQSYHPIAQGAITGVLAQHAAG